MIRMTVLASGSKGNSTVVATSRTRILVDCGLSCRELFKRMQQAGEDPRNLDAVLITHEHQDHVQGVAVTARRLGVPVYFTAPTHRAWMRWMVPQRRMTYSDWLAQRAEPAKAISGVETFKSAAMLVPQSVAKGAGADRADRADILVGPQSPPVSREAPSGHEAALA